MVSWQDVFRTVRNLSPARLGDRERELKSSSEAYIAMDWTGLELLERYISGNLSVFSLRGQGGWSIYQKIIPVQEALLKKNRVRGAM